MKKLILTTLLLLSTNAFAQSKIMTLLPGFEIDTYGWGWNTPSAEFPLNENFQCSITFVDSRRLIGKLEEGSYISKVVLAIPYALGDMQISSERTEKAKCFEWYDEEKTLCRKNEISHFYQTEVKVSDQETYLTCTSKWAEGPLGLDAESAWQILKATNSPFVKFND